MTTTNTHTAPAPIAGQSKTFVPISATRRFRAPGYSAHFALAAHARAYLIEGNAHPHFAVTGEIYHKATRTRTGDGTREAGCIHDEIGRAWPAVKPLLALHGSNADDGEPTHAEENGWYWLAGALPEHMQGRFVGEGGAEKCIGHVAALLRIPIGDKSTPETAAWLADVCANSEHPRAYFNAFIAAQRPRWQAEAAAARALIRKLAA